MQIRTRLTLQFAIIFILFLVASLSIVYYSSAQYREREFFDRLKAKASTTADLFISVDQVDSTLLRLIDENKKDLLPNENITVFNTLNKVVYTNTDTIDFHTTLDELNWIRDKGEVRSTYGNYEVIGMRHAKGDGGFVVTAGAIDKYGKSKLRNLRRILIFVLVGGILVVCLPAWIYAGRALYPINNIVNQINRISASNLHARLPIGKNADEIARLSQTFNRLIARLEEAFNLQKHFVANVSHELKNPLSIITSQLEVALIKDREGTEYRRIIASVLEDTKSLNKAAISLLDLASLAADDVRLPLQPIRIDEVLWATRERLIHAQPLFNIHLNIGNPDDEQYLTVAGDEHLLGIAFANLMENGCKYSPDHTVRVHVSHDGASIVLQFEDNGPGIKPEELSQIFEPFYRGSNSKVAIGYGIGLSLVQRILIHHHSTIAVQSTQNQGSRFIIHFPIDSSAHTTSNLS